MRVDEDTDAIVNDIIAHHGVKGMKWGVRKDRSPQSVSIATKRKGTKSEVKTKGGGNQPVHPDAVSARTVGQQRKKSGLDTLSNKELEAYARRLDLEQRVKRLESQDTHGKNFIQKFFREKKNRQLAVRALTDENNIKAVQKGAAAVKAAKAARTAAKVGAAAA